MYLLKSSLLYEFGFSSPLKILSIIIIKVPPRAAVITPAVAPDTNDPIKVPTPGMHFNIVTTANLPNSVAVPHPTMKSLGTLIQYIDTMLASIVISVGIKIAQSENGIGDAPTKDAAATPLPTAISAYFFYVLKKLFERFER